jgi:hypothetical protein
MGVSKLSFTSITDPLHLHYYITMTTGKRSEIGQGGEGGGEEPGARMT